MGGVSSLERPSAAALAVAWHDLECGGYRADLALWRRLAAAAGDGRRARVLDIGAGTGRVALPLARAGHAVTALERDPALLQALSERGAGLAGLEPVLADAREFELGDARFDLCLVPMQTLQLLGDARQRARFFGRARAHLRPGSLLACAIVTHLDRFDSDAGDVVPHADTAIVAGVRYSSRPVRVAVEARRIVIERERSVPALGLRERDAITLTRVAVDRLGYEMARSGLRPQRPLMVAATDEHVSSEVVVARA